MKRYTARRGKPGLITLKTLLLVGALLISTAVQAQILIGQTAGFTGPVAAGVKETSDGARLYIDKINREGGIRGQ